MATADFHKIVERIVDLPTLPKVVMSLVSAIEDPNSNARIIHQIMSNDPVLAAKILKLVNSSFYGLATQISSIQQAVVILGFNTVRSMALSASVFDTFTTSVFSHEGFWQQSLACALMCEKLSGISNNLREEVCFSAGLLHGIGKIILDQYAENEFGKIISLAQEKKLEFIEAEKEVYDTSHAEIGYWLVNRWKLPEVTQDSIRFQDRIEDAQVEYRALAAAIQLSRLLCRKYECENGSDFSEPQDPPQILWEYLEIDNPQEVEEVLRQQISKASELLDLII